MSTSVPPESRAFLALGRFLGVGGVGGGVIGAVIGVVLMAPGPPEYWLTGAVVGTPIGLIAGLLAEAVTFMAVLLVRRTDVPSSASRLSIAIPVPLAVMAAWGVTSSLDASAAQGFTAAGVAAALAIVAVTSTARWCTAPLAGQSAEKSRSPAPSPAV